MKRSAVPALPSSSKASPLDYFNDDASERTRTAANRKARPPPPPVRAQSDDGESGSDSDDDDAVALASVVAYGIVLRAPSDLDSRRREMLTDPSMFQKRIEAAIRLKFDDVQIGFEEITSGVIDERGKRNAGKMNFGLFIYVESKASWIEEARDPSACGLMERLQPEKLALTSKERQCLIQASRDIYESLFGRKGPSSFPGSRDADGIDMCHVLCM